MRTLKFSKYQGLGNSFLITERYDYLTRGDKLAKLACDKHYGIGADGMMFALENRTESVFDYQMKLFNADGSLAEMSGNGIRCFTHYLINNGLVKGSEAKILTDAGILEVNVLNSDPFDLANEYLVQLNVRVQMGKATVFHKPENEAVAVVASKFISNIDKIWEVEIGNPHLVIYHHSDRPIHYAKLYHEISSIYRNGINMEVISKVKSDEINLIVYERGVGPTMACGTGSVASAVCFGNLNQINKSVKVNNPGGVLTVDYLGISETEFIGFLTGPSEFVATAELSPEGI
jgi:diaminopimelate epimerase